MNFHALSLSHRHRHTHKPIEDKGAPVHTLKAWVHSSTSNQTGVSGQLHLLATLPWAKSHQFSFDRRLGSTQPPVNILCKRENTLARNETTVLQMSSPQPNHYTKYTIPAATHSNTVKLCYNNISIIQYLVYSIKHFVAPTNSILIPYPSVRTRLIYNDTNYSVTFTML
jgi:hypothetical protein